MIDFIIWFSLFLIIMIVIIINKIIIWTKNKIIIWIEKEIDYGESVKLRKEKEIEEERRKYYESNKIGRRNTG